MKHASEMQTNPQGRGGRTRQLAAVLALLAPLSMGARECEIVVVGDETEDGADGSSSEMGCTFDGKHYSLGESFPDTDGCNTCGCTEDGVACTLIGCTASCGGLMGASCPAGSYCAFGPEASCGAADQSGTCQVKPTACDDVYDPVCGCDGKTYSNACEAAGAGVSVASPGECGAPKGCMHEGTFYAVGDEVPSGDSCNTCGCGVDGQVFCTLIGCGEVTCEYQGITYAAGDEFPASDGCNTCSCGMDGNVACTEAGCARSCGQPTLNVQCFANEYCAFPMGSHCGADGLGTCQVPPDACDAVYNPVTGCDGKTYSNACEAARAGIPVNW